MKILLMSNSPTQPSGYGTQTAQMATNFKAMGHEVILFPFYGLRGSTMYWNDMLMLPNEEGDWGQKEVARWFDHFECDVVISLIDVWVYGDMRKDIPWVPWTPVDHDPVPPGVVKVLQEHTGLVKPIAMTSFGQEQLRNVGIESYYIPHTIDTEIWKPDPEARKVQREAWGWDDLFVVGTVATNHNERKNWNVALQAFARFNAKHPDSVYYCHCDPFDRKGIDLQGLRLSLGLEEKTFFPSKTLTILGIPTEAMVMMYNTIDVMFLPSKGEGFGIPIIEAQACGTPVITTACTGQKELVDPKGGWLMTDLNPVWSAQRSYWFECSVAEAVNCLEKAYKEWKKGKTERSKVARRTALQYDSAIYYNNHWPVLLEDVERILNERRSQHEDSEEGETGGSDVRREGEAVRDRQAEISPPPDANNDSGEVAGTDTRECSLSQ